MFRYSGSGGSRGGGGGGAHFAADSGRLDANWCWLNDWTAAWRDAWPEGLLEIPFQPSDSERGGGYC